MKEKIKTILTKAINIRTTYLVLLVVVSLVLVALYFSYALFTVSVEKKGVLNVEAANLYAVVTGNELNENRITLEAGTRKKINIEVQNINSINAKFYLYYKVVSGSNITVGIGDCTENADSYTKEFTLEKYGNNNQKEVTIIIENKGTSSAEIEIGSKVGLQNKPLTLENGEQKFEILSCVESTPESCFVFDESTGGITGYDSSCTKDVVIPKTIEEVNVTSIEANAFKSTGLTSAVIPNGVTSIGEYAFGYNQLKSVVIPGSVTNIDSFAFQENQLTSIIIPEGVTSIGDMAFDINRLTTVMIPSSVTNIGYRAFQENQLTSVIIKGKSSGSEFETYGAMGDDSPFVNGWAEGYDDPDITWIPKIPEESCFTFNNGRITGYDSTCPKEVVIPEKINNQKVTEIGSEAFVNKKITALVLPEGLLYISEGSFWMNNLKGVVIPSSVTTIERHAFTGNQLKTVIINGKKSKDEFALYGDDSETTGDAFWGWASGYSDANITWNG